MDFEQERKYLLGNKLYSVCARGGFLTNNQINERINFLNELGLTISEKELIDKCNMKTGSNLETIYKRLRPGVAEKLERIENTINLPSDIINYVLGPKMEHDYVIFTEDYDYAKCHKTYDTSFYELFENSTYFPITIKHLLEEETDEEDSEQEDEEQELESDEEKEEKEIKSISYFRLYNTYIQAMKETWDMHDEMKEEQTLNDEMLDSTLDVDTVLETLYHFLGNKQLDLANLRYNMPEIATHFTTITGIKVIDKDKPLPCLDFDTIKQYVQKFLKNVDYFGSELNNMLSEILEDYSDKKISGQDVFDSFIYVFPMFYDSDSINQYSEYILSSIRTYYEKEAENIINK
jgi:hypothetical protein